LYAVRYTAADAVQGDGKLVFISVPQITDNAMVQSGQERRLQTSDVM